MTFEDVVALQERIRAAQEHRMRTEAQAEHAKSRAAVARQELLDRFGVLSSHDAEVLLARLQTALEETIARLEKALNEAGT